MKSRLIISGAGLGAAMLLLAGCGDDRPVPVPMPQKANVYQAPPHPKTDLALSKTVPSPTANDDDPLASQDQLASGSGDASGPDSAPPPAPDALLGPGMPTQYSHWLNVEMRDADVTTQVDGIRIGGAYPVGTRDITMRLHKGPNSITIVYKPHSIRSWVSMTVVEGEHHPPIAPLASFRQAPLADDPAALPDTKPQPITKTLTFYAH